MTEETNNEGLYDNIPVLDGDSTDIPGILPSGTSQPIQRLDPHEIHNEACGCMPSPPEPVTVTVQDTDLGASKPVPQPKPKQRPLQLPVVIACGHKLDTRHFPTEANCEHCWMAFLDSNAEGIASVHTLLMERGTQAVTAVHGRKFTKWFGRYLQKKLMTQVSPEIKAGIDGSILDIGAERQEHGVR
jgi:hypothetical protein